MENTMKMYVTADEAAQILGVSRGYAYKIIRGLNNELKEKGYRVISGKVPTKYFEEKFYGMAVGCSVAVLNELGKEWWIGMKNVQISEELFVAIMRYFMLEQEELLPLIKQGLEKKLDAMVMRELYIKYKTALTEEEKEKARKEYLDRRGVPESFRW